MIDCITGGGSEEEDESEVRKIESTSNDIRLRVSMDMVRHREREREIRHVVIVMDALKGFSLEPLQWTLDHLITTTTTHAHHYSTITLLGVMPWIPFALSCKTWLDVWTYDDVGDLSAFKAKPTPSTSTKTTHTSKHHKIQEVIHLCHQKGVVPCIKVAMGHPLRLVVLEQTTNLHASFVVLDRHLRKNRTFFQERLPSSVVMMKTDGEVDMLRARPPNDSSCDTTPQQSPATLISTPEVILSHAFSQLYSKLKTQPTWSPTPLVYD
ncbi:hypothetical protein M5689_009251 [Euphorbia peplus]|nr:hypothetical protein M5689_009251 [Euphorbia peplus]